MKSIIEQIRNATLDLDVLKSKRALVKKLALEHRDSITDVKQADEKVNEVKKIDNEIETRTKNLEKLQNEAKLEERGEHKIMEKTGIETRDEVLKQFKENRTLSIKGVELRSVLLASAGIAKPTLVNGISDPFNTQISILDQVKVADVTGAGSFKESALKTYSSASEKTDGVAQDASDPVFGTMTLTPELTGVVSYVSRELRKTTPLNYAAKVQESALIALKVKLAQKIVTKIKAAVDDDSANLFQTLETSTTNKMLTSGGVGAITAETLRNIVMNYGGDANVYGNATLYLNKSDLIAFGDVRGTNEKKAVYEITPNAANPNTGIIKDGGLSVPYCIVPTLTKLSGTSQTSSAIQTMIYGSAMNFELALFGDYEIRVSSDYKFAEGLDTILGEAMTGGNIIAYDGFEIVTIPSNA